MKINNLYKTRDLHEASFLLASRLKLIKIDKIGNSFWFIFEDKSDAESLSNQYWTRTANINAKEYSDAIRCLKDMMFSKRDQMGKCS